MNKYLLAFNNLIHFIFLKIKYNKHFRGAPSQLFEKIKIVLLQGADLFIGEKNQSRGNMYIVCQKGKLEIGSHCFFNTNASITALNNIHIGNRCSFGNNLVIVDHDHDFRNPNGGFKLGEVFIGDNVWVGANVTILKNTKIGNNCVIAAGSIVSGDVPEGTLFVQKRITDFKRI